MPSKAFSNSRTTTYIPLLPFLEVKPVKTTLAATTALLVCLLTSPCFAEVQVNDSAAINLTMFVPCAAGGMGENVDLSGRLHTLISYTINGNRVSGAFHFQPQGINGVGESTGLKYRGTGVTEETFAGSFRNGENNNSFVNNFRIIGQGRGNNYGVHETLHFSINADGNVTVFHDDFGIECK